MRNHPRLSSYGKEKIRCSLYCFTQETNHLLQGQKLSREETFAKFRNKLLQISISFANFAVKTCTTVKKLFLREKSFVTEEKRVKKQSFYAFSVSKYNTV